MAHRMVCNWGMNDEFGPVHLSASSSEVFLGRDMMRKRSLSQQSSNRIDKEVTKTVNFAYTKAMSLLKENLDSLHTIANQLIEVETINGSEILKIVQGAQPAEA